EQGGGAGDSRVNIRGADQRNVGVMVDGVPMNDMETGQVYWSNWDGLSDVTRTMQVQRGLGASRLAIPSVGGTVNILTRGIDDAPSVTAHVDFGNNGLQKTYFGFNSGVIGNGWGITAAGARQTGNGWVDQTWDDQWAYFIKVQKRFDKSLITFSMNGAPQSHGQRYTVMPVAILDSAYAAKLGVNVDSFYAANGGGFTTHTQGERGLRYNPDWGFINYSDGQQGKVSGDVNFYNKPLFNLSWFYNANDRLTFSTVAYLSHGYGGGATFKNTPTRDTLSGQYNLTSIYNNNSSTINPVYSTTEHYSSNVLLAAMNNHIWYGLMSTATYRASDNLSLMFGIDGREYKGTHYRMVYDLLGGDYYLDNTAGRDQNQPVGTYMGDPNFQYYLKHKGDKVGYYNDSYVQWEGLFTQAEYVKKNWSAFLTVTGSASQYQRVDHFKKQDITLDDGTIVPMIVGYGETYFTNGTQSEVANYTDIVSQNGDTTFIKNGTSGPVDTLIGAKGYAWGSDAARTAQTKKRTFPGFTIKTGANYNLNDNFNVFMNLGYMNLAPRFNSVFDNNNHSYPAVHQQEVYAAELGFGARFETFAANVNAYYTNWLNKSPAGSPTTTYAGDPYTYDLQGLNTLLRGIEFDANWKPCKKIQIEGLCSFGNWTYNSSGRVYLYDANYVLAESADYSAKGIHLGNSAQTQLSGSIRWSPFKGCYIKPRYTYFARNYADFDPIMLTPVYDNNGNLLRDNRDRESWLAPSYGTLDLNLGYNYEQAIDKDSNRKLNIGFRASIVNILNASYITDARNGVNFDATTATVFMGMGRRFTVGMNVTF
ncbi:MAG TPA: TonB-dependent receptor plug domain-containing protein, partial [Bacteroidia bacterium]|nr:TonB-dependent receptor plug domain-containing protein [Bacteroidia bacterium]